LLLLHFPHLAWTLLLLDARTEVSTSAILSSDRGFRARTLLSLGGMLILKNVSLSLRGDRARGNSSSSCLDLEKDSGRFLDFLLSFYFGKLQTHYYEQDIKNR
jgi:hypothetical protein